mgnify:CR=1 FL=1
MILLTVVSAITRKVLVQVHCSMDTFLGYVYLALLRYHDSCFMFQAEIVRMYGIVSLHLACERSFGVA